MAACGVRAFAVLALLLAGCSGAGNEDLFDDSTSPGSDTSSINPAPSASGKTPANDSSGDSPNAPTGPGGATPTPADTPPAAPTCSPEIEPNNSSSKATSFAACLTGKIDASNDVDWGSFMAPKGATSVSLKHAEKNGGVSYAYFMNGLPLFADGNDHELDVVPGATYTVQIRGQNGGNNRPTYELDVSFQ